MRAGIVSSAAIRGTRWLPLTAATYLGDPAAEDAAVAAAERNLAAAQGRLAAAVRRRRESLERAAALAAAGLVVPIEPEVK